MKRDWLLYLVIFSLALNFGTLGTLIYFRWWAPPPPAPGAPPLPFQKLLEELSLDPAQRQKLRSLAPGHFREVRELEKQLQTKRRELLNLLRQEELPDWTTIQAKIREIGNLHLRLEEEKVSHLLEVQKHLSPEQRQLLVNHLERRLLPLGERRGHGFRMGPWRRETGPPLPSPGATPE